MEGWEDESKFGNHSNSIAKIVDRVVDNFKYSLTTWTLQRQREGRDSGSSLFDGDG